jgi:hypothetical protein
VLAEPREVLQGAAARFAEQGTDGAVQTVFRVCAQEHLHGVKESYQNIFIQTIPSRLAIPAVRLSPAVRMDVSIT